MTFPRRCGTAEREFVAQYLNRPPELEPGTYCANCGHNDPVYMDRMASKVLRRVEGFLPCCGDKHCGCVSHMVQTFEV